MSDWKKWCRLCANVESIEDVSIDLKQSISSIFEVKLDAFTYPYLIPSIFF